MNVQSQAMIAELVKSRRPGYSMPAELYNSPEVLRADIDVFFKKHWIVAGVEADLKEPGDVLVVDIGNSSVVMTRDDDGALQAFHNTCRHRGARLLDAGKDNVGRIVCPYHQWSYELDGTLAYAASMGKDFKKECHALKPVQIRSLAGILMICIDGDGPQDYDELEAVMTPRLLPFDLANAKIAHEIVLIEEGNWKLSIDNNRECYHCAGSHPELGVSIHPLDLTCDIEHLGPEELAEWHEHVAATEARMQEWEAEGHPSRLVEHMDGRATIFRTQRMAIADAGESHTMDTRRACTKLMGKLTNAKLGDLHFWTHNSWHHFFADHAVVMYIVPLSEDRTELRSVWLVHPDAVEGVDYDLQRLTEVWDATNREDADLVKITQQGVKTSGYTPGPLSVSLERLVELNSGWYIDRMKAHGYT